MNDVEQKAYDIGKNAGLVIGAIGKTVLRYAAIGFAVKLATDIVAPPKK